MEGIAAYVHNNLLHANVFTLYVKRVELTKSIY